MKLLIFGITKPWQKETGSQRASTKSLACRFCCKLNGNQRRRRRRRATDQTGHARHAQLEQTQESKQPVSVAVGDSLYVHGRTTSHWEHCFEDLLQGQWLPFCGLACYVPEYKLWFGLSSRDNGNLFFCASDLAAATSAQREPILRDVWKDLLKPPKEWIPVTPYPVHLGSGSFCIARFFSKAHGLCDMTRWRLPSSPPWRWSHVARLAEDSGWSSTNPNVTPPLQPPLPVASLISFHLV